MVKNKVNVFLIWLEVYVSASTFDVKSHSKNFFLLPKK